MLLVDLLLQPLQPSQHLAVASLLTKEGDYILLSVPRVQHSAAKELDASLAERDDLGVVVAAEVVRRQLS